MSISHIVQSNGPVFTVLFVTLSLVSLTLVIWRWWLNHNAKTDLVDFLARLNQALAQDGLEGAIQMCDEEPGIVPKLFTTVLQTGHEGKVATRNAMANLIELEIIPDLNFLLPQVLVFAKLAPMLGLLGTVWGMILAFEKIASATKVNPSDLSRDIGMALFTTAEGLMIAIPLIFAYTMFREQVSRFELDLQRAAQAAMDLLPKLPKKTGEG
ncbi:MAG TPA: MotA/TolQ/ExbB proton channel family protein [Pirellulales bacterium]|jgi:biopolymer transport protein ExbB|nr:MotA/TolQ/ExbB proton channel family protein [Pirellulales bacterium]